MDQGKIAACEYQLLEGDIHAFKWNLADQRGLQEFIQHYETALTAETSREEMRILLDFRMIDRPPSIAQTFRQVRQLLTRIEERPGTIRAAYLFYREWGLVTIVKTFLELLRLNSNRQFYHNSPPTDEITLQKALAWLRETDTPPVG